MIELYSDKSSDARINAQRNLCGRTHYVDTDTLRWHKSRVLRAHATVDGLLFWIRTSDALDMNNTRRGYRYVIFDLHGNVLSRPDSEHAFRTHRACEKAMWGELEKIDAAAVNLKATDTAQKHFADECDRVRVAIRKASEAKAA